MSIYIDRYRNKLKEIVEYGGSLNETSIRRSFIDLVNDFAKDKNLLLVEELSFVTNKGKTMLIIAIMIAKAIGSMYSSIVSFEFLFLIRRFFQTKTLSCLMKAIVKVL